MATVIGLTGAAMFLGVPSADAAPKTGLTLDVTCPGLGSFMVVTPSAEGAFTPAFGLNKVFIPYEVQGTVTIAGEVVDEFHDIKPAPVPATAISCSFEGSFEDNGVQIELAGTAVVVPRGPKG